MSVQEPPIEEAVIQRCIDLATAAAGRVYRELIEAEPVLPVVVVTRLGGGPSVRVAGAPPAMYRAVIRVEVISDDLPSLEAVQRALMAGLDQWKGTFAGVTVLTCYLQETAEGSSEVDGDQVLRIRQLDFRVMFR